MRQIENWIKKYLWEKAHPKPPKVNRRRKLDPALVEARATGKKTYIGRPCPRGHGRERYASNRGCVICVTIAMKLWHDNNKDKKSKAAQMWASRNRARAALYAKQWRERLDPTKKKIMMLEARLRQRDYYKANKEERAAYSKLWYEQLKRKLNEDNHAD